MSAAVEEETKGNTDTGLPDWAVGYSLILPCDKKTPQCDQEAEWFANQHRCIRAHLCEDHMLECYRDVSIKIDNYGSVKCKKCERSFKTFASFIKAVRI